MIKLERPINAPLILINNHQKWTDILLALVSKYGSYEDIPAKIKESAVKYYRHQDIKDALFPTSYRKCAFCEVFPEDSGHIEVEHFNPKSLYPEETFQWNNLLPACRRCNGSKDDHDTRAKPLVNPYIDNPEDFFDVIGIELKAKNLIAENTIEACQLKGIRLLRPYADLLVQFKLFEGDLKVALDELVTKDTPLKKKNHLNKIRESIERIEVLMKPNAQYSFFCKITITTSEIYQLAKQLLEQENTKAS